MKLSCQKFEVEEYILTLSDYWLFFFFFLRKTSHKWKRGGRGPSLSLLFPGNESPSSSLNSGAHRLHFHSVLSKTIYSMGSSVSGLRAREVQPNENYRMWSTFSRQSDGLVQRDPADDNVHCKGAFSDTTGRCSLCFNFFFCLFVCCCFFFAFWYLFVIYNSLHTLKVCL